MKRAKPESGVCNGVGKAHDDAVRLVYFLMEQNGVTEFNNEEIARKLQWMRNPGGGVFLLDTNRLQRARQHINDKRTSHGQPCTGFNLNYRRAGKMSVLALIDPQGSSNEHHLAAASTLYGAMTRMRQHHTENQRLIQQFDDLADFALARGDKQGYRILQRGLTDLDRYGTIHNDALGDLVAWLSELVQETPT